MRRSSKLAQYARMERRKSASDAVQKFPSLLEIERLSWDYGNKNIGPSNPSINDKWGIICAISSKKSTKFSGRSIALPSKIIFQ